MSNRILLVERNYGLSGSLGELLSTSGYRAHTAPDGSIAYAKVEQKSFDLVLLDVIFPDENVPDISRELRQQGIHAPLLMLAGEGTKGADESAPATPEKRKKSDRLKSILARVRTLLIRCGIKPVKLDPDSHGATYGVDDLVIDFQQGKATRQGKSLSLSVKEMALLRYLIERRGTLVFRQELLNAIWNYETVKTRTLDVHISALRQKLEPEPASPRYIQTIRGSGYMFAG